MSIKFKAVITEIENGFIVSTSWSGDKFAKTFDVAMKAAALDWKIESEGRA